MVTPVKPVCPMWHAPASPIPFPGQTQEVGLLACPSSSENVALSTADLHGFCILSSQGTRTREPLIPNPLETTEKCHVEPVRDIRPRFLFSPRQPLPFGECWLASSGAFKTVICQSLMVIIFP